MSLKWRKKAVLLKMETEYGVDPVPTGLANAIQALDVELTPLQAEALRRGILKPFLGQTPATLVGVHSRLSFGIEFAGSGTAGTPPAYGPILRACGMAETAFTGNATIQTSPPTGIDTPVGTFTYAKGDPFAAHLARTVTLTCTTPGGSGVAAFTVSAPAVGNLAAVNTAGVVMTDAAPFALANGATIVPTVGTAFEAGDIYTIALTPPRVEYDPVSEGEESASCYVNLDGILHKMTGVRGNVRAAVSSNAFPRLNVELIGLFTDPAAVALPTVDYSGFKDPKPSNRTNTIAFSLHGFAADLATLELDLGQAVRYRGLVNTEKIALDDRAGTGRCVIDAPPIGTKDFFAIAKDGTQGALSWTHGLTSGHCVAIDAPAVQIEAPAYNNDSGTAQLTMPLALVPTDAGDDELKITVK
ncbi:hypothetical protein [Shumkonia mesophila]|uniref:hypothetical protein n=1 Tax=Shumkonia mesophila TaxID=2838854 RepID=UPI00293434C5|nr:hypothetical protein [Shumkonia mesophila]